MTARRPFVVAVLLASAVLLGPSTAARADGELGLSRDGRTWSDRIETPLFDEALLWVPGDRRSATFYVRNQAPGRADLAVDLDAGADPSWIADGGLDVTAEVSGGAVTSTPLVDGWRLASARAIAPGEVLAVTVTVSFPVSAGNDTQDRAVRTTLRVRLAQDLSGSGAGAGSGAGQQEPGGTGGDGSDGPSWTSADGASGAGPSGTWVPGDATPPNGEPAWLPGTGGPPGWVLLVAGLLLGLGGSLARHGPRTAHPPDDEPQHPQQPQQQTDRGAR